jgi:serine/threonine protein kinase
VAEPERRYRILEVLGRGGFGSVYKARFSSGDGFEKLVAIKLLSESVVTPEHLQRFRDEARMLGLVRDRAVVQVDAPARLGDRWAVVMEYVDGASLSRLLHLHGHLPPRVVVEIAAEVLRALVKFEGTPGPDGRPLRLLHRDLKPGNLQLTPAGEVKILDFGNARADFEHREALTTTAIAGTPGYVPPERFDGVEDPRGDVFSLGVCVYRAVTGKMPADVLPDGVAAAEGVAAVLEFSAALRAPLEARPDARRAEALAHALLDRLPGDRLRTWSEAKVPAASTAAPDDLVGTELSTASIALPPPPPSPAPSPAPAVPGRARWLLVALVAASALSCAGALGLGAIGFASLPARPPPAEEAAAAVAPEPVAPGPVAPEPVALAAAPEPAPAEPAPEPAAAPPPPPPPLPGRPVPAPVSVPAPAAAPSPPPTPPAPVEEPAELYVVVIGSVPIGLKVWIDGAEQKKAAPTSVRLRRGTHEVAVGDPANRRDIEVGASAPVRWVWSQQGATWQPFY